MRTEAEIREALELIQGHQQGQKLNHPALILARDATVEALRYALGIDDEDTTPMTEPLANIIKLMKEDESEESTTVTE